jgi:hypothetical protein
MGVVLLISIAPVVMDEPLSVELPICRSVRMIKINRNCNKQRHVANCIVQIVMYYYVL